MNNRLQILCLLLAGSATVLAQKPAGNRYPDPLNMNPPHISTDKTVKYDFDIVYVRAPRARGQGRLEVGRGRRSAQHGAGRRLDAPAPRRLRRGPGAGRAAASRLPIRSSPSTANRSTTPRCTTPRNTRARTFTRFIVATTKDRPAHAPDLHAQHRSGRLVENAAAQLGRVQPRSLPAARRQDRLRQRSQRLQGDQHRLCPQCPRPAAFRHGRRRRQRRVHRPPEPRHGPAPGHPERRPDHVQLARIAGPAQPSSVGRLVHPSRRHELGPALQCLRDRQRHGRLHALPGPALRREHRRRSPTTTSTTSASAPTTNSRSSRPRATPASARATRPTRQRPLAPRPARGRPAPCTSVSLQPLRHRGADAVRPEGRLAVGTVGTRQERFAARWQIHPPAAAPGQPPADGLVARFGQQLRRYTPAFDSGIYLIKSGKPIDEPGPDAAHQERPEISRAMAARPGSLQAHLRREEPRRLAAAANDGKQSPHLPEGTPFGLVGTSSLYKRESYPYGVVRPGEVTADFRRGQRSDRPTAVSTRRINWSVQGADAGLYENRRHPRHPHRRSGADHERQAAQVAAGSSTTTPRNAFASSASFRCASLAATRRASNRSIPTATPTPASSPRFPPTWPGPSRRSTSAAWC